MIEGKGILAIIPARGGSKALPGKNIRPLSGKPLIGWAIESARQSRYIDRLIVSTDAEQIADAARSFGAEVPFLRPGELAGDDAESNDVVLHAIDWVEQNERQYDIVMLLQPTSPLRSVDDIDGAIEMMASRGAKAVVSVCQSEHSPCWAGTLPANGCMKDFVKAEYLNKNRQQLPVYYRINGALYLACIDYLKEQNGWYGKNTFAYIMDRAGSVDIDDEVDFGIAEFLAGKSCHCQ